MFTRDPGAWRIRFSTYQFSRNIRAVRNGRIKKQRTKQASFQASFIGPDQRRHCAPVIFASKMNAERWLARERDLMEKCAGSGDPAAA
jgi:hypothetical protein